MKKFLSVLLSLVSVICIAFTFGGCETEQPEQTELSAYDKKLLEFHRVGTIDDDFEDNRVCVILKSAFSDLEEISFKDLEIVEKVSKISYVDLYSRKIPYSEDGKIELNKSKSNHMFRIVIEDNSKEKVLRICELLETLDMILIAEPDWIDEIVDFWAPDDEYYDYQLSLQSSYGIDI